MWRRLFTSFIELALGGSAGFATYLAIGETDRVGATLSVLVGLVTMLLAATLVSHFEAETGNQRIEARLEAVLAKLGDRLASHHEVAQLLKYGSLRFGREKLADVFHQILWQTKQRYWTTSYQIAQELVVHDVALAIQEAKAKIEGVDIRRIYFIDDRAELANLEGVIARQKAAGIDARWLKRSELDNNPILKDQVALLPSLDFALVDSRLLLVLHLDDGRHLVETELHFDEEKCRELEQVYRSLLSMSHDELPVNVAS